MVQRGTVSLDYPLGTDSVDWRWCRWEEMCRSRSLMFLVLFTSIYHHLALLEISASVRLMGR